MWCWEVAINGRTGTTVHYTAYPLKLLLMVKQNRVAPVDMENHPLLVSSLRVSYIYIYPLDIWVVSINSTNEHVLLLTLFDPRLNTNPSLKLIPSFGLPGRQLKNVEAMTLAFMLIMKLETLKPRHPFKRWHPPTKDGFSSDNFQHHTPVYDFGPPKKTCSRCRQPRKKHNTPDVCQRLHSLFPFEFFLLIFPVAAACCEFSWHFSGSVGSSWGLKAFQDQQIRNGKRAWSGRPHPRFPGK